MAYSTAKQSNSPHTLGYEFSNSEAAVKQAGQKGMKIVSEVKKGGRKIRDWSNKTVKETKALSSSIRKKTKSLNTDKTLWEIAYWENEISRVIRVYFSEVSMMMNELRKLNPPLKTSQIDPFLAAILAERRLTLAYLEPLTKTVDELGQMKTKLSVDYSPQPRFQPFA